MIYAAADARRLALVRIWVFSAWIVERLVEPLAPLAQLPVRYFQAQGPWLLAPAGFSRWLLSAPVLHSVDVVSLGLCVASLAGAPRPRLWATLSAVMLTAQEGFVRGFGHANHAQMSLLYVTYALCFAPAWDALSLSRGSPAKPARYVASFGELSLALTLPYFLVGATRLFDAERTLFAGDNMLGYVAQHAFTPGHSTFTLGRTLLAHPDLNPWLNVGLVAVTLAELCAPWISAKRRFALPWLMVMLGFHCATPLLMNIWFPQNMLLMVLLVAWPCLWPRPAAAKP